MPKDTKVYKMAHAMEQSGVPVGEAIATAQKRTGLSYATGQPPMNPSGDAMRHPVHQKMHDDLMKGD